MIYTEMTKKAALMAFKAHEGVYDKSGFPYVMHPLHVAESMTSEDACVVALLHDVVEDTDISFDDLEREGFTKTQLDAIKLLTHDENVPYLDYVKKIKENPIAREVKISDITHNSDNTRLKDITEKDIKRNEKYAKALEILLTND